MRDGRSSAPSLPSDFDWELTTRTVNLFLHSNYKIEEVMTLPCDVLYRIRLLSLYYDAR